MTRGGGNTMGADNQSIGSDWRGWGVRMGLVSVMAATGMVLAGHAAAATPMVTQPSGGDGTDTITVEEYGTGKKVTFTKEEFLPQFLASGPVDLGGGEGTPQLSVAELDRQAKAGAEYRSLGNYVD